MVLLVDICPIITIFLKRKKVYTSGYKVLTEPSERLLY